MKEINVKAYLMYGKFKISSGLILCGKLVGKRLAKMAHVCEVWPIPGQFDTPLSPSQKFNFNN